MARYKFDHEYINWTKGPLALKIIKYPLDEYVKNIWESYIASWTDEERLHVATFLKDVSPEKIKYRKDQQTKERKWECMCYHQECLQLFARLYEKQRNPSSKKIQWFVKHGNDAASAEGCYWRFANMYMLHTGDRNEISNTCPGDTDISMIIKLMKNCKLFPLDINVYDEIQNVRNALMHSSDFRLSTSEMKNYINVMNEFLEYIRDTEEVICVEQVKDKINIAIQELNKLQTKTVIEVTADELGMIEQALEYQRIALVNDMNSRGIVVSTSRALRTYMQKNVEKSKEYSEYRTSTFGSIGVGSKTQRQKYWINGTLAVRTFSDSVREYAVHMFENFQRQLQDAGSHFDGNGFNTSWMSENAKWNGSRWEYNPGFDCEPCKELFGKVIQLHTKKDKTVGFENCRDKEVAGSWGIAKLFMPPQCTYIESPEDTDDITILNMIMNCSLFQTVGYDNGNVRSIIEGLIKVHQSVSLTDSEQQQLFGEMKQFLSNAAQSVQDRGIQRTLKTALDDINEVTGAASGGTLSTARGPAAVRGSTFLARFLNLYKE